jgi:hypothetical protein
VVLAPWPSRHCGLATTPRASGPGAGSGNGCGAVACSAGTKRQRRRADLRRPSSSQPVSFARMPTLGGDVRLIACRTAFAAWLVATSRLLSNIHKKKASIYKKKAGASSDPRSRKLMRKLLLTSTLLAATITKRTRTSSNLRAHARPRRCGRTIPGLGVARGGVAVNDP